MSPTIESSHDGEMNEYPTHLPGTNTYILHNIRGKFPTVALESCLKSHLIQFTKSDQLSWKFLIKMALIDPDYQLDESVALCQKLFEAQIPFVLFSSHLKPAWLKWALQFGCVGYLNHQLEVSEMAEIIENLVNKKIQARWCQEAAEILNLESHPPTILPHNTQFVLTERQQQIFISLAEGKTVKEVARELKLSDKSVDSHKYRIMRKLNIHDRVHLSRLAIREGWIEA